MTPTHRPRSLVGRLVLWAALLLSISIPLFWVFFAASVQRISADVVDTRLLEFADQVRGYWASTQALPDAEAQSDSGGAGLGGPDLEWVWQITVAGRVVDRSELLRLTGNSLVNRIEVPLPAFALRDETTPLGALRLAERMVAEGPDGEAVHYLVGLSAERYDAYVLDHKDRLQALALIAVAAVSVGIFGMLAVMILTTRRHLGRVEWAMQAYEQGSESEISGAFPREIQSIVDRMNGLLRHNQILIGRTRKYVSKIAHDINHPLAIIKNGLQGSVDKKLLHRQVDRMSGLVDRYSSLARAIGPEGEAVGKTDVGAVLNDVAEGMAILYRRTPLQIRADCPPGLSLSIPRHDLEAMVSNLVSNAHKYADSEVVIRASAHASGLQVVVEDDGPGIPQDQRETALNWGKRLDEAPPGTGFGLSIVQDIAELYGGSLRLDDSELGGLRVTLVLALAA